MELSMSMKCWFDPLRDDIRGNCFTMWDAEGRAKWRRKRNAEPWYSSELAPGRMTTWTFPFTDEAIISSMNKALKETSSATEKYIQEYSVLNNKVNALKKDLFLEKYRRDALASTLSALTEELNNLKTKSEEGLRGVWNSRSNFCTTVQRVVDEFDIRALLVKPKHSDNVPSAHKKRCSDKPVILNEGRLKLAIERRDRAIAECDRLMLEPHKGKEFIRVKEALDYCMRRNLMD